MVALLALALAAPPEPFPLKDGDRIVWLGGTHVERAQRYGHWETALHAAFPKANFTLRNLGWSGDTVYGDARAGFEDAKKGFERLVSLTLELKPTVLFVNYGLVESFEGEAGLPKFEKGLEKLLDALKPTNARVVLFAPPQFEAFPAAERNPVVKKYGAVVKAVAASRGHLFADVSGRIDARKSASRAVSLPFTDNGMHYTGDGYKQTDEDFLAALGVRPWDGGTEELEKWRSRDTEPLRKAILAKNELFFHRWRPQNETYLFGFRKHEQGKNAKEVAEFDPLVDKAEKEIAELKK